MIFVLRICFFNRVFGNDSRTFSLCIRPNCLAAGRGSFGDIPDPLFSYCLWLGAVRGSHNDAIVYSGPMFTGPPLVNIRNRMDCWALFKRRQEFWGVGWETFYLESFPTFCCGKFELNYAKYHLVRVNFLRRIDF